MKWLSFVVALTALCLPGYSQTTAKTSSRFKALLYSPPPGEGTWRILERNGANRPVAPYLSSLGLGESGTGIISSPAFTVTGKSIELTLCGHHGPAGTRMKTFVALVDASSGKTLRQTFAPGSDPLKPSAWNVEDLKGRRARFEAHDHDTEGAFAWLGIGSVDAGPGFKIDFQNGLPETWKATAVKHEARYVPVAGGVPFVALASHQSMLSQSAMAEVPCGFNASRLFFLGATVSRADPLEVLGTVEIVYRTGPPERHPLMFGYTLDGEFKLPGKSGALHLHRSADPFQYYFVVKPRDERIDRIRLQRSSTARSVPRITAITCETSAQAENLQSLPDHQPGAAEWAWIESHSISASSPGLYEIKEEIKRAHKLALDEGAARLRFERTKITDRTFEAASVCDVNGDGKKDIVSGAYWYEGPGFEKEKKITEVKAAGEYWDDFSDYPLDVNGDGHADIVTGAFFGGPLRWLENPKGKSSPWKTHTIEQVGAIETTRFWDVDGDGSVEICPNASGNVVFFRLVKDPEGRGTGKFTKHVVKMGGCGHGLGFGDVNGDGRGDFIVPDAWIEAPEDPLSGQWLWRDDGFRLGTASVPILVHDVNGDERADLIVGQAHGYGLDWYEQLVDESGKRFWVKHRIDRGSSQYHDMLLADIDNDERLELVTGKRYRAHNGHDPGAEDPLFVRYFDMEDGTVVCHTVDYGPAQTTSGVGIHFWVEDVDGNGWQDIVAPGKEGLYLFRNLGALGAR